MFLPFVACRELFPLINMPRRIPTILQCCSLAAFLCWLTFDPSAEHAISKLMAGVGSLQPWQGAHDAGATVGWPRVWAAAVIGATVVVCIALDVTRTLGLRRQKTSLRGLLGTTLLVALWCSALMHHSHIAWQAKKLRTHGHVHALDRLAANLQTDWPASDGEIEGLGPFTAYPFDSPSVLLLLTPYPLSGTDTVICAVERARSGALRFQLGGRDGGDWLECHRGASRPAGYTSGLSETRRLERFSHLDENWYLVRYREGNHS